MMPGPTLRRLALVLLAICPGFISLPSPGTAADEAVVAGEIGSSVSFPNIPIAGQIGPNALVMLLDVPAAVKIANARKLDRHRWSFPVKSIGDVKLIFGSGVTSGATFKAMIFRDDTGELTERTFVLKVLEKRAPKQQSGEAKAVALPIDVNSPDIVSSDNVMLIGVPEENRIEGGQKVGDGLWLIDRKNIADAKIVGSESRIGGSVLKMFAVGAGGKVNSKSRVDVDFARGIAEISPLDGQDAAAAVEQSPAQSQDLGKSGSKAAVTVPTAESASPTNGVPTVSRSKSEEKIVNWRSLVEKQKQAGNATGSSEGLQVGQTAIEAPRSSELKSDDELIVMGSFLVKECTTCHNVYAKDVGIPVMAGLTVDRFIDTMDLYRRGKRSNKVMESIANSLSDTETRALALYLSKIKPDEAGSDGSQLAANTDSEEDLLAMAKVLVRECTTCHNLYGNDIGIPVMIGLSVERFQDVIDLYRRKKRSNQIMQSVAESLSEKETRALALYLSRIKPPQKNTAETAPSTQSGGSVPSQTSPATIVRRSEVRDVARIVSWVERGQAMLDEGNVASGRLLLKRAAEYGDPRGAIALGGSYDPNIMKWDAESGIVAEPLTARRWYLEAKALGAGPEVDRRLANLPP